MGMWKAQGNWVCAMPRESGYLKGPRKVGMCNAQGNWVCERPGGSGYVKGPGKMGMCNAHGKWVFERPRESGYGKSPGKVGMWKAQGNGHVKGPGNAVMWKAHGKWVCERQCPGKVFTFYISVLFRCHFITVRTVMLSKEVRRKYICIMPLTMPHFQGHNLRGLFRVNHRQPWTFSIV